MKWEGEKKGEERGFLHYDFDRAVQRWSFWYWMIVEIHPNFQNLNSQFMKALDQHDGIVRTKKVYSAESARLSVCLSDRP